MRVYFLIFSSIIFYCSCNINNSNNKISNNESTDYYAIIEIPAGTNHKIEYNKETDFFECNQIDGKDRIIDFLPYPANYGYIENTLMGEDLGGDGDPLDVFIISESEPTSTIIEFIPIGIIKMIDDGEFDYKIIGTPKDESKRLISATTFKELSDYYPAIIEIIEKWLISYKNT